MHTQDQNVSPTDYTSDLDGVVEAPMSFRTTGRFARMDMSQIISSQLNLPLLDGLIRGVTNELTIADDEAIDLHIVLSVGVTRVPVEETPVVAETSPAVTEAPAPAPTVGPVPGDTPAATAGTNPPAPVVEVVASQSGVVTDSDVKTPAPEVAPTPEIKTLEAFSGTFEGTGADTKLVLSGSTPLPNENADAPAPAEEIKAAAEAAPVVTASAVDSDPSDGSFVADPAEATPADSSAPEGGVQ